MSEKLLIVEDDKKLNDGIRLALKNDAYFFYQCRTLQEAREILKKEDITLVLLDVNLPDGNGIDFVREIRKNSQVPIILLTVNNMEVDIVTGLEAGANDYITKPFSVEELLARIRVTQRRLAVMQSGEQIESSVFENGGLKIDYTAGCTYLKGEELHLTPIEYKLLCLLSRNVGKVLTHTYITQQIWGRCSDNDVASLRVFMATLRKKLEPEKNGVQYIQTHIGIGYRMLRIEKPEQETKKDSINPQTII